MRTAVLSLLLLVACRNGAQPDGVLPPEKMQALLWDLMQADEVADMRMQADSLRLGNSRYYTNEYQKVLQLHGLSQKGLRNNLAYYKSHPNEFKPIIDSLQKSAERLPVTPAAK